MIIEMRTYDLLPGTVAEVEQRYAKALPYRGRFSKLGAFWRTEVGALNRVIHVWPYDSWEEKERIRREADDGVNWPPDIHEFVVAQESKLLTPAPYSPPLADRALGGLYEIRTYTIKAGKLPDMIKAWGGSLEERLRLSPLAAVWYSAAGPLNQFIHVWPYRDMADRERIREESRKLDTWPPPSRPFLVKQENMFVVPATFSPLH